DIQLINNAARVMFGIHGAAIGQDLIHQVRTLPSPELRRAVDRALRGEAATFRHRLAPGDTPDGRARWLEVRCQRLGGSNRNELVGVSVVAEDITDGQEDVLRLTAERDRERDERDRTSSQLQRLVESNQQLLNDNDELSTANASLRSANEELLVANEES